MDSELARRTTNDLCAAMESFESDELAYLALTGKIEIPLRDRLAWKVYGNWPSPPYYTSREWNKTDFAIIEDGQPILLLEAKALYSFDAIRPKTLARYEGYIRHDIDKATALAGSETQVMVAVFMTHVAAPVPDHSTGSSSTGRALTRLSRPAPTQTPYGKTPSRRLRASSGPSAPPNKLDLGRGMMG